MVFAKKCGFPPITTSAQTGHAMRRAGPSPPPPPPPRGGGLKQTLRGECGWREGRAPHRGGAPREGDARVVIGPAADGRCRRKDDDLARTGARRARATVLSSRGASEPPAYSRASKETGARPAPFRGRSVQGPGGLRPCPSTSVPESNGRDSRSSQSWRKGIGSRKSAPGFTSTYCLLHFCRVPLSISYHLFVPPPFFCKKKIPVDRRTVQPLQHNELDKTEPRAGSWNALAPPRAASSSPSRLPHPK